MFQALSGVMTEVLQTQRQHLRQPPFTLFTRVQQNHVCNCRHPRMNTFSYINHKQGFWENVLLVKQVIFNQNNTSTPVIIIIHAFILYNECGHARYFDCIWLLQLIQSNFTDVCEALHFYFLVKLPLHGPLIFWKTDYGSTKYKPVGIAWLYSCHRGYHTWRYHPFFCVSRRQGLEPVMFSFFFIVEAVFSLIHADSRVDVNMCVPLETWEPLMLCLLKLQTPIFFLLTGTKWKKDSKAPTTKMCSTLQQHFKHSSKPKLVGRDVFLKAACAIKSLLLWKLVFILTPQVQYYWHNHTASSRPYCTHFF